MHAGNLQQLIVQYRYLTGRAQYLLFWFAAIVGPCLFCFHRSRSSLFFFPVWPQKNIENKEEARKKLFTDSSVLHYIWQPWPVQISWLLAQSGCEDNEGVCAVDVLHKNCVTVLKQVTANTCFLPWDQHQIVCRFHYAEATHLLVNPLCSKKTLELSLPEKRHWERRKRLVRLS